MSNEDLIALRPGYKIAIVGDSQLVSITISHSDLGGIYTLMSKFVFEKQLCLPCSIKRYDDHDTGECLTNQGLFDVILFISI